MPVTNQRALTWTASCSRKAAATQSRFSLSFPALPLLPPSCSDGALVPHLQLLMLLPEVPLEPIHVAWTPKHAREGRRQRLELAHSSNAVASSCILTTSASLLLYASALVLNAGLRQVDETTKCRVTIPCLGNNWKPALLTGRPTAGERSLKHRTEKEI